MVREIEASPNADGIFKRTAPAPFRAGTIVALGRGIAIRNAIDADGPALRSRAARRAMT